MSHITKHVSKAGKVEPGDRVTLPVKIACKPDPLARLTLAQGNPLSLHTAHVCPSRVIEDELQDKEVYDWGLMLLLGLSSDNNNCHRNKWSPTLSLQSEVLLITYDDGYTKRYDVSSLLEIRTLQIF